MCVVDGLLNPLLATRVARARPMRASKSSFPSSTLIASTAKMFDGP